MNKLYLGGLLVVSLQVITIAQAAVAPANAAATAPTTSPATTTGTSVPTTAPASAVPPPAAAAQPKGLEIRDDGRFFDAETLGRANGRIEQIHQRFGKEVVVETYDAIPDDRKQRFGQLPKADFFQEWLKDRARARSADGVFILICRNPGHLEMAAGTHTRERLFTAENVRELNEVMTPAFRKHEYNLGLMRGLNQIEQRMERNAGQK